ncbi:MAG: iron-sulfur cluster assembly scaffold protein [Candidatus Micrarchaeota archaeon]|nr:iron-sulfur cluster assembly scaffold protein [Candidatus Micrarchaeota archaeon]
MYSEKVMEHFRNPRNQGKMENPDGTGVAGNPLCGDVMKFYIKVRNGTIVEAKWETFGCAAAIATSSALSEMVKGKTLEEALEIKREDVSSFLGGLPPIKEHCSNLAVDALRKAIKNYRERVKE